MSADKVQLAFHEAAEVFCVETRAPAGHFLTQHVHEHDHLSFLASGTADLVCDGEAQRLEGPCMVTLKAGVEHSVVAVTPLVWLCLWGSNFGMQDAARLSVGLVGGA